MHLVHMVPPSSMHPVPLQLVSLGSSAVLAIESLLVSRLFSNNYCKNSQIRKEWNRTYATALVQSLQRFPRLASRGSRTPFGQRLRSGHSDRMISGQTKPRHKQIRSGPSWRANQQPMNLNKAIVDPEMGQGAEYVILLGSSTPMSGILDPNE